MRKLIITMFVITIGLSVAAGPARAEDEEMGDVMLSVMQIDLNNKCSLIWWTEDVWAYMTNEDTSTDALYGYFMMKSLLKDYIFFSAMNPQTQSACTNIFGTPLIRNEDGVGAAAVPTHQSLQTIMPGLIAFPNKDLMDRQVISDSTKEFSVEIKYEDRKTAVDYSFDVPPDYPDAVYDAVEAMKQVDMADIGSMDEDAFLFKQLAPRMKTDIRTGIIAAPISNEFFDSYFKQDEELMNDPEAMAQAQNLVRDYSFFVLIPADDNRTRIEEAAKSAVAIDTAGNVVTVNTDAKKLFMSAIGTGGDVFEILVFPKLGRYGTVNLVLRDPESKNLASFTWTD